MELIVYFKIVKIVVSIKTIGTCSAIDKGAMISIFVIPVGFVIADKKQGGALKL
jgi:hypothetical protein